MGGAFEGNDGRLSPELAAPLEPELQDALGHPVRREILRVLNRSRGSRSLVELGAELRGFRVAQLGYHLQLLRRWGAVASDAGIGVGQNRARYGSELCEDRQVRAVLRATERWDREHREAAAAAAASPLLTMFRVPRPVRTIRLSSRSKFDAGRDR